MNTADDSSDSWLVACLCADWCHVCLDYRQIFVRLARELAGEVAFIWVVIEDDEDALGTVEVDDFPTLLIAHAGQIRHFSVVMPNAPTSQRLLRRALAGELAPLGDAHLAGLPKRLDTLHRAPA